MVLHEINDRIEEDLSDEEVINYRLKKITRLIEEERKKIKSDNSEIDPYFDSIKNWCPL